MYDFHSHILPRIDDGSHSVEESLEMLRESARQGVTHIVASPHFYADQSRPETFFENRRMSWNRLLPHLEPDMPQIKLGAEVHYFDALIQVENILDFCIEGTHLLLLEMPFSKWSERTVRSVIDLNGKQGIQILLAHFERYLTFQPKSTWDLLRQNGIQIQSNAEFFLSKRTRRRALKALSHGQIYLLGSDCHNMGARAPDLGPAVEIIAQKLGRNVLEAIDLHGQEVWNELG